MAKSPKRRPSTEIWDVEELTVRRIQPYEAHKSYICPGCRQTLPAGMGHYVVVPVRFPDERGHWHRGCWDRRQARASR